jgi:hypothetical protein
MTTTDRLAATFVGKSLSTATFLPEDLVSAFLSTLTLVEPAAAGELRDEFDHAGQAEQDDVLNSIMSALNDIAPLGTTFGPHEGNSSDFGFWPNEPQETFENETRDDGRTTVTLTEAAADELTGQYAVSLFRCGSCFIVGLAPNTQDVLPPARPDFEVVLGSPGMIVCTTCECNADGNH